MGGMGACRGVERAHFFRVGNEPACPLHSQLFTVKKRADFRSEKHFWAASFSISFCSSFELVSRPFGSTTKQVCPGCLARDGSLDVGGMVLGGTGLAAWKWGGAGGSA